MTTSIFWCGMRF